ncbi:MAG: hypothetical protein ABIA63_03850 [bacterium]
MLCVFLLFHCAKNQKHKETSKPSKFTAKLNSRESVPGKSSGKLVDGLTKGEVNPKNNNNLKPSNNSNISDKKQFLPASDLGISFDQIAGKLSWAIPDLNKIKPFNNKINFCCSSSNNNIKIEFTREGNRISGIILSFKGLGKKRKLKDKNLVLIINLVETALPEWDKEVMETWVANSYYRTALIPSGKAERTIQDKTIKILSDSKTGIMTVSIAGKE